MRKGGMNAEDVKKANRGLVLKHVVCEKDSTRSGIAGRSGLSRMTVSNIVNSLIQDGYLQEVDEPFQLPEQARVAPGKKPVRLTIAAAAPRIIGLYISRTKLVVGLSTLECVFEQKETYVWQEETAQSILQRVVEAVLKLKAACPHRILGVGVAAIGPLDSQKGVLLKSPSFFGVEELALQSIISARTGLATKLLNDMDAAALAELLLGRGKKDDSFVYVGLSHNGVGAGVVTNRRLFQNGLSGAGEIGHMSINFQGPLCVCGNRGCLEVYINLPAFIGRIRALADVPKEGMREIGALYGKQKCQAVFEDMLEAFSVGLTNICNMLAPEVVILGHEAIYFSQGFRKELEKRVNARLFDKNRVIRIRAASFGEDSPLAGASCTMINELFEGRLY